MKVIMSSLPFSEPMPSEPSDGGILVGRLVGLVVVERRPGG